MQELLDQLEMSLNGSLYYLSLMSALTLPDIAAALDSDDGRASGPKYVQWYDHWVRPEFSAMMRESMPESIRDSLYDPPSPMTGDIAYWFRCSLLHQGTTEHPKSPYSKILFVEPGATKSIFHYNVLNDVLNIDVNLFCREIVSGTRKWLLQAEGTERFHRNHSAFVRRYPDGVQGYIVGVPVIA